MPRIVGVDLPKDKRIEIALTYIHGIGNSLSNMILFKAGIDPNKKAKDLKEDEVSKIASVIQKEYKVEGDLRREVTQNIKRLMEISCYRGIRHRRGLPASMPELRLVLCRFLLTRRFCWLLIGLLCELHKSAESRFKPLIRTHIPRDSRFLECPN